MELVPTSYGNIPHGRRPVEGGYEDHGGRLYHAVGLVHGVKVPGKTGTHLGGCNISFGGAEHVITQNYEILQVLPTSRSAHTNYLIIGVGRTSVCSYWFVYSSWQNKKTRLSNRWGLRNAKQ